MGDLIVTERQKVYHELIRYMVQFTGLGMCQFISTDQHKKVIMVMRQTLYKVFVLLSAEIAHAHLLLVIKTVTPSPKII